MIIILITHHRSFKAHIASKRIKLKIMEIPVAFIKAQRARKIAENIIGDF